VLRQLESDIRGDLGGIQHFEKLSDELIWPNLDQDISFFTILRHTSSEKSSNNIRTG